MWKLRLLFLVLIIAIMSTDAGTQRNSKRKRQTGSYANAGGYAGAGGYGGGNGGYVGGYAGDYGTGSYYGDYAPDFGAGFIDPYLFHQQLTAQILAQHAAQTNAIQQQVGSQAYYGNKAHRYAPNYAAASGSVGPGGYYQSAYVNPAGSTPNIVNRFGASSPGGYKGVSVSSFSSSSDVNGKRTGHRGAQTTVNDNGKVTTYTVGS